MTDTTNAITLPPIGPGPVYQNQSIWLPQLFIENLQTGSTVIEGRIFVNCTIEGPGVLLPADGCEFSNCELGDAGGDPLNLILRPGGPEKVVGVIPFINSAFRYCRFGGVGFTGSDAVLEVILSAIRGPEA